MHFRTGINDHKKINMKILVIFGTRPEAIKMAPLIKLLKKSISVKVCVTAQHRELLDQVMKFFKIKPDYDFNLMEKNQDLGFVVSRIIDNVTNILKKGKFDWVLVQGDTASTMAGTMAAFLQRIPVGHLEAGLRTYDLYSPFPEELNRQITSKMTSLHFAPTLESKRNLINEGFKEKNIFITGNTGIDALQWTLKHSKSVDLKLPFNQKKNKIILVTGHRRENFGKGFKQICKAIKSIAKQKKDIQIVFPVHLNPKVRIPVNQALSGLSNLHLFEPMEYQKFIHLMSISTIILTDSGGIQEEAPSLGKPVLVMRDSTERIEALSAGSIKLVGTNSKKIFEETMTLLDDRDQYLKMAQVKNPYGDGTASEKILKVLKNFEKMKSSK